MASCVDVDNAVVPSSDEVTWTSLLPTAISDPVSFLLLKVVLGCLLSALRLCCWYYAFQRVISISLSLVLASMSVIMQNAHH